MDGPPHAPSVAGMNIIVGINEREQHQDALALGQDLARLGDGRLLVAHVYPWSRWSEGLGSVYARMLREDAEALVESATRTVEGVAFETRVLAGGSAPRLLHHLAREEDADLLVIGSSHRGLIGRTLVGSTGDRILHGSPCPVAVAPRGRRSTGQAPSRIAVAYDASREARAALAWATELAEDTGATVSVLDVYRPLSVGVGYPGAAYGYDELDRSMRAECRHDIESAVAALPEETAGSGEMLEGPVASTLAEAAAGYDLLVMGSRGYGPHGAILLGGVAHRLAQIAPCPLIVLPRSATEDEDEAFTDHAAAGAEA